MVGGVQRTADSWGNYQEKAKSRWKEVGVFIVEAHFFPQDMKPQQERKVVRRPEELFDVQVINAINDHG
jgi:hypothetical protein